MKEVGTDLHKTIREINLVYKGLRQVVVVGTVDSTLLPPTYHPLESNLILSSRYAGS